MEGNLYFLDELAKQIFTGLKQVLKDSVKIHLLKKSIYSLKEGS